MIAATAEIDTTTKYAMGFRFHPFDEELIDHYLKPEIMGKQLPCNLIKHKQVYGSCSSSNPWCVFDSCDWFRSPGLKKTEKCVYVFAKLSKLSRSKSGTWKNTSKRAGCGTWAGKGKQDRIVDCDGNLIGEKRYLVFEISDIDSVEDGFDVSKVGQYKMYEYSLSGVNSGLMSSGGATTVLCKITYDSSKECQVNLKSGAKLAGQVSRSISEVAHVKEENRYNNVEGTSTVSVENLSVLDCGVGPVGCNNVEGTSTEKLSVMDSGVGPVGYDNVEGTSTNKVLGENLTVLDSGLGPLAEWSAAAQSNNDVVELGDFCEGLNFDDVGGGFSFADSGENGLSDSDINWIMDCLDCDHNEEPSKEDGSSELKRKFESEEDLYQSKRMCLANHN